jgi:hypothetical protein
MRHVVRYAQGDAFSRIDFDYNALNDHKYLEAGVQNMNSDVDLRCDIFDGAVNIGCGRRATQQIADKLVNDPETLPDAVPIRKVSRWRSKESSLTISVDKEPTSCCAWLRRRKH